MRENITLSDFEKMTGIPNQTISRAIKTGKIPRKYVIKEGNKVYILEPKTVAAIWLKNITGTTQATYNLKAKLENYLGGYLEEMGLKKDNTSEKQNNKENNEGLTEIEINDQTSYPEAQRLEKVYKAREAQLTVLEKEKKLIDKDIVYKQLFAFGREVRNEFQSMPTRIAADIAACGGNVNKITILLATEINLTLTKISELDETQLG